MEGLPVKRRRIYSLEPNKKAEAMFARKYVGYLVPALTNMKGQTSFKEQHMDSLKRLMKYEVDMALVLSAQGSAWSNALKLRLQQQHAINVQTGQVSSTAMKSANKRDGADQNSTLKTTTTTEEDGEEAELMRRLRRLVPGGEEIGNDQEMLAELKSYVRCLQMQVTILQCLAQTH